MSRYCLARYASPLGPMLLASEGEALVGVWFEGQRFFCAGVEESQATLAEAAPLCSACAWLDAYFAGQRPSAEQMPPLAPMGTPFQQAVWQLLRRIPYGSATTYGALAAELRALSHRACAQAVGAAVGRNPISLLIPCHRVVGAGGSLTGYAAGVEKKQWLLHHESSPAAPPCFFPQSLPSNRMAPLTPTPAEMPLIQEPDTPAEPEACELPHEE